VSVTVIALVLWSYRPYLSIFNFQNYIQYQYKRIRCYNENRLTWTKHHRIVSIFESNPIAQSKVVYWKSAVNFHFFMNHHWSFVLKPGHIDHVSTTDFIPIEIYMVSFTIFIQCPLSPLQILKSNWILNTYANCTLCSRCLLQAWCRCHCHLELYFPSRLVDAG